MTPPYHNSPPSPFPLELNQDQHHQHLISATPQVSSSSSSFSNPIFFNPAQDQGRCYYMALNHFQNDQEVDKLVGHGGSSCDHISLKNESDSENKFSFWNRESKIEDQSETFSVKWMPSKMRMMRKMINSEQTGHADIPLNSMKKFEDQKQPMPPAKTDNSSNNSFNNNNTTVRVCADCNTTKTPLWRSGPRGPKSLCNACGIRQRKARRAMAAAAAAANGTILATNPPSMKSTKVQHKDKRASKSYVPKFKKKCKLNTPDHGRKKVCIEDFTISLSKNSAFQRVFPQDEKEAAILLMALSYGLVHG